MTCVSSHNHCWICAYSIDNVCFKGGYWQRGLVLQQLPQLLKLPLLVEILIDWQRCLVILDYLVRQSFPFANNNIMRSEHRLLQVSFHSMSWVLSSHEGTLHTIASGVHLWQLKGKEWNVK